MENPHLENQYDEGQLLGGRGVWEGDDPHISYVDFYERMECWNVTVRRRRMSAAEFLRRRGEINALCKEFPAYAVRYNRGEKPTLND